jgi:hypothetical protein
VLAAVMIGAGLSSMAAIGIADDAGLNGILVGLPVAAMVIGGVMRGSASDRLGRA